MTTKQRVQEVEAVNRFAEREGWAIFNDCEIQRIDCPDDGSAPSFRGDDGALRHVRQLADAGSALHRKALALIGHGPSKAPETAPASRRDRPMRCATSSRRTTEGAAMHTYREIIKVKAEALARAADFGSDETIRACLHDLVMFSKNCRGVMSLSYPFHEIERVHGADRRGT